MAVAPATLTGALVLSRGVHYKLNSFPAEVESIRLTDEDLRNLFSTHSTEIRRHFDVAAERMEKRFDLLSESVTQIDQKVDRTVNSLHEEMKRGFADTQAMIKFSHAELDRRVRTLEESHRSLEATIGGLSARIDRLENSTH